jgi:hypothetical protein
MPERHGGADHADGPLVYPVNPSGQALMAWRAKKPRTMPGLAPQQFEQLSRSPRQLPQTAAVLSGPPSRGATAGASGIIRVSQTVGSAGRRGVIAAKLGVAAAEHPGMMVMVAMASCRRRHRGAGSHHRRCGHDRENLFHQLPPLSPHPSTPGPASGSATHLRWSSWLRMELLKALLRPLFTGAYVREAGGERHSGN